MTSVGIQFTEYVKSTVLPASNGIRLSCVRFTWIIYANKKKSDHRKLNMRSLILLNGKETTNLVFVVFDINTLMSVKSMLAVFTFFSRRQLAHKTYNNNEIVKNLCQELKLKFWLFKLNIRKYHTPQRQIIWICIHVRHKHKMPIRRKTTDKQTKDAKKIS